MNAGLVVDTVVAASVAFGVAGWCFAWFAHSRARADRAALGLAREREREFVESARRLSDAAADSVDAVRSEIDRALRALLAPIESVLFFEEREAQLVCVAAFGQRDPYVLALRLALDDERSLPVLALRRGHRVLATDLPGAVGPFPAAAFAVAIPLLLATGRRCALYASGGRSVDAAAVDGIVRLVDGAAPAYRIALERTEDRARAQYDGLTGLLSPRALRDRLADLVERARHKPLGRVSVLFVDTDRFKAWNDTYGHASGDALLRELAQLLRAAATGAGDIVARNGGDEFCVVLVGCEKSKAVERADRLRAAIAGANFEALHEPLQSAEPVRISASIGVACFPVDADAPGGLLEKADEAMYHSKRTGRDGVSFWAVDGRLARVDGSLEKRGDDRRRE